MIDKTTIEITLRVECKKKKKVKKKSSNIERKIQNPFFVFLSPNFVRITWKFFSQTLVKTKPRLNVFVHQQ